MEDERKHIPKWLVDIQQNSYLPELMISGTVIFSMSYLGGQIENISLNIRQFLNIPGGALIFMFLTFMLFCAYVTIKWGFIVHFLLRAFWVSQIGLSYIFPKGINSSDIKQPESFKKNLNLEISGNIIKIEKWASSLFSLMILISFFMLSSILACVVIALGFYINLYFGFLVLSIFVLYLIDLISFRALRNVKVLSTIFHIIHLIVSFSTLTFIYRNIYYIYQVKLGKLRLNLILLLVFGFGFLAAYPPVSRVMRWPNILEFRDYVAKVDSYEYEDRLQDDQIISFAAINSYKVGNSLSVFMTYTKKLDAEIEKDLTLSTMDSLTALRDKTNYMDVGDMVEEHFLFQSNIISQRSDLMIGKSVCEDVFWVLEENNITGQLGFRTEINVDNLRKGFHVLTMISTDEDATIDDSHRVMFVIPFYKK